MEISCLFSKEKIDRNELIRAISNTLNYKENEILIVEESDYWLKRENMPIAIEYNGFLDEEDDEEYFGYHYYDIWYEDIKVKEKLKNLEKEFSIEVIIDME